MQYSVLSRRGMWFSQIYYSINLKPRCGLTIYKVIAVSGSRVNAITSIPSAFLISQVYRQCNWQLRGPSSSVSIWTTRVKCLLNGHIILQKSASLLSIRSRLNFSIDHNCNASDLSSTTPIFSASVIPLRSNALSEVLASSGLFDLRNSSQSPVARTYS